MITRQCEACGGTGHIIVGAGFAALEGKYPDLPIREMAQRGWFDHDDDGEDIERCDAGFLAFWGAATHEEVRCRLTP